MSDSGDILKCIITIEVLQLVHFSYQLVRPTQLLTNSWFSRTYFTWRLRKIQSKRIPKWVKKKLKKQQKNGPEQYPFRRRRGGLVSYVNSYLLFIETSHSFIVVYLLCFQRTLNFPDVHKRKHLMLLLAETPSSLFILVKL